MEESLMAKSPQKYEYILNEIKYDTEETLHAANAGTCLASEHEWKKSFVYGKYSCKKCEAIRMKIK
jgi:hypothetical protein